MKKVINIILIVCCVLITGCSDDDNVSSALKIIKADVNIKAAGGEASIEFQSASPVEVVVDAEWCEVTEQTASLIKISVEANADFPGRSALITISDGMEKQVLTLVQEGYLFTTSRNRYSVLVTKGLHYLSKYMGLFLVK